MSREIYDLCRKYKHFYNKHEDVKSWNRKYHDIDLSDAVATTKIQLGLVENELQKALFREFGVVCSSIDVSNNAPYRRPRPIFGGLCTPICYGSTAKINIEDSNRFVNLLSEYMYEMRNYE